MGCFERVSTNLGTTLAETNPFAALQPRKTIAQDIQMQEWVEHFKTILNTENTTQAYNASTIETESFRPITEAILELKPGKASGPDGIFNEHIKNSMQTLTETWADLFNKCLEMNQIPSNWRSSIIKLLDKGNGDTQSPDSYRGIALSNAITKLYTKLITNRMTKEIDHYIPDEQYGFRRGRSTLQAIANLHSDIQEALDLPKGKLYTAFIDYHKGFDSIIRNNIKKH